jgi:hypothetical protein
MYQPKGGKPGHGARGPYGEAVQLGKPTIPERPNESCWWLISSHRPSFILALLDGTWLRASSTTTKAFLYRDQWVMGC